MGNFHARLFCLTLAGILAGCNVQAGVGSGTDSGSGTHDRSIVINPDKGKVPKKDGPGAAKDKKVPPSYNPSIGKSCAVTGVCPGGLTCAEGGKGYAQAYCTAVCTSAGDCPPRFACQRTSATAKECVRRGYCAPCQNNGQCNDGQQCIQQGGGRSCLKPCSAGSTECPRFATCTPLAGGHFCVHKAGSCQGNGGLCAPCTATSHCKAGGLCLTFSSTGESFCGTLCAGGACPGGYGCYTKENQCVPSAKPSCVASLSPMMEVGDTVDDLALVGKVDADKDYSMAGEKLQLLRLSQFKSAKVILLSVAAGWCSPCKQETKLFKALLKELGPKGLVVVQSLIQGVAKTNPPTPPDLQLLDNWIQGLNAVGAIGIDPKMISSRYNTKGTVPLNMIINAKSLKVLEKWNASSTLTSLKSKLSKYL